VKLLTSAWALITTWGVFGLAVLAAISLAFILVQCSGRSAERNAWEARTEKARADAETRARTADAARAVEVGAANDAITQAREELDNATRDLPDESPSAIRRARMCAELQQQARAAGAAPPAC
jgi:C4-dicarboxylate-specific signal transduction histidine kinase